MFLYYKCYFDKIEFSEGININKTCELKEYNICHYCYFLNKGFKLQLDVCNRGHDLLEMSINLSDIVILTIKSADYCCIISGISKNKAINLMQNTDLTKKNGTF